MLNSLGILLVATVIIIIEVPSLLEKKQKKELIVFSILLIIGVTLSILRAFGINIPNPLDLLTFIFKPMNDLIRV
ncbi:hypothetical protein C7437_11115 [Psychrobacillus insolitus]|uniref:Stage III sporulation protein AF n=1 Tax=Psychrobacillus insolitus TaxID=1461 RepID=A0A2W7P8Z9_9BACI|nr:hypothetical protein [Psychrobacillus insolitus]PZX02423.1 hypothetical protein C7437_11115 [Psychrobacillus insolitus]